MKVYVLWMRYDVNLKWIKNIYLSKSSAERAEKAERARDASGAEFYIEMYKVLG